MVGAACGDGVALGEISGCGDTPPPAMGGGGGGGPADGAPAVVAARDWNLPPDSLHVGISKGARDTLGGRSLISVTSIVAVGRGRGAGYVGLFLPCTRFSIFLSGSWPPGSNLLSSLDLGLALKSNELPVEVECSLPGRR